MSTNGSTATELTGSCRGSRGVEPESVRSDRNRDATSAAEAGRSAGSLLRHSPINWDSPAGSSGRTSEIDAGGSWRIACRVFDRRVAPEGSGAGGHLEHQRAVSEEVGANVDRPGSGLLRRHVREAADEHARSRQLVERVVLLTGEKGHVGRFEALRQPEIEHPGVAVPAHQDVARFEIAMHDAARVGGIERVGDLDREVEQSLGAEPVLGDELTERPSLDELHREVGEFRALRRSRRS